jgi:hypothetical protein
VDLSQKLEAGRKHERTVWAEFAGVAVELRYVDLTELSRMVDRCQRTVWRRHQAERELDTEKLAGEIGRLVKGWRGLNLAKAAELLPIAIEADEDPAAEVPCEPANVRALLMGCYGFADWVQATVTDLALFRAAELEAEKKTLPLT